ncbi:6-phosphofructokinase [Brumicola pallidula]|uniref:6-phosphofructokinase n=1 Tax=Brumicola pallidula DSM 14239 = ACAM 615 TaxID=1121922 RepID=K6Z317_9ALTE|nr:6-phosphofructokinase [Glaciecola pallidula]GAC30636.1 6-phosphofructokinase 1 [Glaciecola pallidula DSM 14239 = ACAM 615]
MVSKIKHIGIFTSGGDAPGMNAALFAVAKTAESYGIKLSGIRRGFEGLIDNDLIPLNSRQLQRIMHLGGTLLKTARSDRFMTALGQQKALRTVQKNNLDALIAIGGDGTFRGMLSLANIGNTPFIGIPGTIDNDITGTDYTLGFDSAVNTAIKCIDNIRDTAESHNRVFLVEVMGRDSGYIGIYSGLSCGADSILIPESDEDITYLLNKIKNYDSEDAFIVVVAEGDALRVEEVMSQIRNVNPHIELRVAKLGHIQRGGNPSAQDRMLGIRLGVLATTALIEGESGKIAGFCNNKPSLSPFEGLVKKHLINTELKDLLTLFCG